MNVTLTEREAGFLRGLLEKLTTPEAQQIRTKLERRLPPPPRQRHKIAKGALIDLMIAMDERMAALQLNNSDVARGLFGSIPDKRGYDVARNRDRVGHWARGRGFPSRDNFPRLIQFLGIDPAAVTNPYQ